MTLAEVRAALDELCASIGPDARASVSINAGGSTEVCVRAHLYPRGHADRLSISAKGDDLGEAVAMLRAAWGDYERDSSEATIRDMALEIIRITHEHGWCSEAALRGGRFSPNEVAKFGAWACELADKMAAGAPFEIVAADGANAS